MKTAAFSQHAATCSGRHAPAMPSPARPSHQLLCPAMQPLGPATLSASSSVRSGRRRVQVLCDSTAAAAAAAPEPSGRKHSRHHASRAWLLGGGAVAALLAGAHSLYVSGTAAQLLSLVRHYLSSSVLAKSGFFAAFSLIFASEIGDKTFFIAALLAMKCGKLISFLGSITSLSLMTVISVAIGYAVKRVPAAIESSEVLGQWLGAALLFYFGVRTLKDAWSQPNEGEGDELEEAEESVKEAAQEGKITGKTFWQAVFEVASLIFVAEWGDRSMLATIALGAAQSPVGVAGGAILGHAMATVIAVVGGAVLSKHISEKTVGYVGGALFLVFSAATALGLF